MNKVCKWTINMENDVLYSTSNIPEQEGIVLEIIDKWKDATIFKSFDAIDWQKNIKHRIMWLKIGAQNLLISSYNKNEHNYVCFIASERSAVQAWNCMKKQMDEWIN